MLPHQRFFREYRAGMILLIGVWLLALGVIHWTTLGRHGRLFFLVATPSCFGLSYYYWRRLVNKRQRRPKMKMPVAEPGPTKTNPRAELPPPRQW